VGGEFKGFNRIVRGGTVNVVFEPGAGFAGMGGSRAAAVWIHNSGGWRIWGGTISNPDGNGILMYSTPGPFTWTGFRISNTGDTCVALYPVGGNINGVTLEGVAGTASPNLSWDPHDEKGTGIHAFNVADGGDKSGLVENTTIVADVLNQSTGAGVEWGMYRTGPNDVLYARATNLGFAIPGTSWTGDAQRQVAGNVVQLWGQSSPAGGSLDIRYAEGNTIRGRILETSGAPAGANYSNVTLDYGVATGPILQNPALSRVAYDTGNTGLRLGVVAPNP
jgi:hypothetical protein